MNKWIGLECQLGAIKGSCESWTPTELCTFLLYNNLDSKVWRASFFWSEHLCTSTLVSWDPGMSRILYTVVVSPMLFSYHPGYWHLHKNSSRDLVWTVLFSPLCWDLALKVLAVGPRRQETDFFPVLPISWWCGRLGSWACIPGLQHSSSVSLSPKSTVLIQISMDPLSEKTLLHSCRFSPLWDSGTPS